MRYKDYLASDLWQENKKRCFEKYGFRCVIKKCTKYAVDLHHLTYKYIWTHDDWQWIRPVCRHHHRLLHFRYLGLKKVPLVKEELVKRFKQIQRRSWGRFKPSDFLKLFSRFF